MVTQREESDLVRRLHVADDYCDERAPGGVVGSVSDSGADRTGVDVEGLIGIDNGALRMRPLARPGWGREGVAYGPFSRSPGLALAVLANNGHNASQTYYMPETPKERVRRWLVDGLKGRFRRPRHHESFAVGWLPAPAATDPVRDGNNFVMHAATADNGELWAGVAGEADPVVLGVQNVPILYVVVLRERGAVYYTASVAGAFGVGSYPWLTPLAIDTIDGTPELYAGIHQRILGEVGYRVDTRVYGTRVATVPEWSCWYGTAHVADAMAGAGELGGSSAEIGGIWRAQGRLHRSPRGLGGGGAASGDATAVVEAPGPSGLVHVKVHASASGSAGVVFRSGADTAWAFAVGADGSRLLHRHDGQWSVVETSKRWRTRAGTVHAIQVLDDDGVVSLHLDGRLAFGRRFDEGGAPGSTGVGVFVSGAFTGTLTDFEAHPARVQLPDVLAMEPPTVPSGRTRVLSEDFTGPAGDLAAAPGPSGACWEHSEGAGVFERVSGVPGAHVRATRAAPNPGRTIYTTPWTTPDYADVLIDLTHPGTAIGEGEAGRGGVVFWQDEDNYLVVNLFVDDTFDGASISTFYHLGGKEVMWDAVWTLVRGCSWGTRNVMEVRFDGSAFLALLDGRPSLYRRLTDVYEDAQPLAIRRVGLIANWEWGDDTGTVFHRFEGRTGPTQDHRTSATEEAGSG